MKRRHRKLPKINTREKKQRDFKSVNDNKKLAWQHLFGNMSAEDIILELNSTWIDSRYQLQIINPQEPIVCDGAVLFQGWRQNVIPCYHQEVNHEQAS